MAATRVVLARLASHLSERMFSPSNKGIPMSEFNLPELPYAPDALEPFMSRETLEFHHGKHHRGYVDNTNRLLKDSGLAGQSLEEIVVKAYGKDDDLFNNAAQHYNHTLFWKWMRPQGGGDLPGELRDALVSSFGSLDNFKQEFQKAGAGQFGSGWVWLASQDGEFKVLATPNGENPLIHGGRPLLGCDVWEHSYYLDHRNDRNGYLEAFLADLVNWDYVAELWAESAR